MSKVRNENQKYFQEPVMLAEKNSIYLTGKILEKSNAVSQSIRRVQNRFYNHEVTRVRYLAMVRMITESELNT
jgi:hypothetical protein